MGSVEKFRSFSAFLLLGTCGMLTGCGPERIEGILQFSSASDAGSRIPAVDAGTPMDRGRPRVDAGQASYPDARPPRDTGPAPRPDTGPAPVDAGPPPPVCGDGICAASETCDSCNADCGECGWPEDQARAEDEMVILVNKFRSQEQRCGARSYPAVGPVTMNNELRNAARDHSQDMADNNYFDHDSQDGRSPWDRIREANYGGRGVGENIAAGNRSAQATFQQWVNSSGHCRNMMNGQANEMGVGYAVGPGRFRNYWTQVFGRQ